MGLNLTVLETAGNFRMADFYEQVDSYFPDGDEYYFTHDGLLLSSTIYSGMGLAGAFFGGIDLNAAENLFTVLAVVEDAANPLGTVATALTAAIDAGMTGTQAIATLFAGEDMLAGFRHDDELWGYGGGDCMVGFAGDDILHGGGGDDALEGGRGRDRLEGGGGRDLFVYTDVDGETPGGWGRDTILDFARGDRIEFLDTHGIRKLSDLVITSRHGDALISTGHGESITLVGVDAAKLGAKDFLFALSPDAEPVSAPDLAGTAMGGFDRWAGTHLAIA